MKRFTHTYVRPLWRLLRTIFVVWLIVNVLLGVVVHRHGQQVQLHQADVIIVLGSGLNRDGSAGTALARRSIEAANLWKKGYAPGILCTGGRTPGFKQSEASACREVLLSNGVSDVAIHLESQSRSTEENALYSRHIMQAQGWHTALLVTDPFHVLRASWILDGYGISHQPAPVSGDQIARGWYFNRIGREVIALQWQAVKNVLHLSATPVPLGSRAAPDTLPDGTKTRSNPTSTRRWPKRGAHVPLETGVPSPRVAIRLESRKLYC